MGQVATFSDLPYKQSAAGVQRAAITGSEMKQMAGEIIRLAPGASVSETVPAGSDHYFYTLTGEADIAADGDAHHMVQDAFAAVQEGKRYTVTNKGQGEVTLVSVTAPPPGSGVPAAGFTGGLAVAARATQPVVDIPDQKKQRIYFVGKEAAKSERSHAMIVVYVHDTVTGMHMHPNAESMFVLLSGKTKFTVNNEDVVVERGQATIFPMGDRHGLRVADGGEGVSFLEFHLPAAYTTVKG